MYKLSWLANSAVKFALRAGTALKRSPVASRWPTTVRSLRAFCLLAVSLLSASAAAAESRDHCLSRIPTSLAQALNAKYPEFRLPLAKEGEPSQVQWSRKHRHSDCVLVATGDFDGNGLADIAMLLPHKNTEKVILVSALYSGRDWSVFELPTWCNSISRCYVAAAGPGKYEMTESFDYAAESPNSRERIDSQNQVIMSGTPESTGIVHAYISGQWLYVWGSD